MNDKLVMMGEEAVVVSFKVLFQHLLGRTEESGMTANLWPSV